MLWYFSVLTTRCHSVCEPPWVTHGTYWVCNVSRDLTRTVLASAPPRCPIGQAPQEIEQKVTSSRPKVSASDSLCDDNLVLPCSLSFSCLPVQFTVTDMIVCLAVCHPSLCAQSMHARSCKYVLDFRFKRSPKELDYDRLMRLKPVGTLA